jgi:hypothetical protein
MPLFTEVRGRGLLGTSPKNNSRKFAVASRPPDAAAIVPPRLGGTPSAPKRGDYVPFVAPFCIKGLRLATSQLPENFSPHRTGTQ